MGFWDRFKKKPKPVAADAMLSADLKADLKTLPLPPAVEAASSENVRAKMDLVLTQMESMNIRMDTISQRMERLERMIQEIWTIAKKA